jgi:hypothetical protein
MRKIFGFMAVFILFGFAAAAKEPSGKVNAYYYAAYADASAVQQRLEKGGFEVLATYASAPKCETIIVTCPGLKSAAAKPARGFGAVMRVLVDGKNKRVAYMNPLYFSKAFLQKDYDYAKAQKVADKLKAVLGGGKPSPDEYDYADLSDYHFMFGMPYYGDMDELAEGEQSALLKKLEAYEGGDRIVFKLDLGAAGVLVGYDLTGDAKDFVEKIGVQNAEVLPYMILIEKDKAVALTPKYYLAVSYPQLSMGEFMTISDVPGEIQDELEAPFK